MKVLLVHNEYGKYSGEEAVVDKMAKMLSDIGYEVVQLRMTTADARNSLSGNIKGFISGIYCPAGVKAMRDIIQSEKPDIVNVHNLYPFISPAALRECKKAGIPVIMTVHNFRLVCPTGLFMREGKTCEICLDKGNEWGCIKYNCEHSILKSIGYAARNAMARINRHYLDCVDVFSCITEFQRNKLLQAGIPREKLTVIPNSLDVCCSGAAKRGDYVAFSGRISEEKGVDMIIEVARRHSEIPFKLAGAVRDTTIIDNLPSNVQLMGHLSGDKFDIFNSDARFFVMASRCYEGFPMSILEAASHEKPVIAPDHGGFTEIIGKSDDRIGLLFEPGNINGLENAIIELWNNPTYSDALGHKALLKLTNNFSTEVIKDKWKNLIEQILAKKR